MRSPRRLSMSQSDRTCMVATYLARGLNDAGWQLDQIQRGRLAIELADALGKLHLSLVHVVEQDGP